MADRPNCILTADKKYRISMELSSKALHAALINTYPGLAQRQPAQRTEKKGTVNA